MSNWHFELWEQLQVRKDGDCFVVVRPDFVDLQNSPAVFFERGTPQFDVLYEWQRATPLAHLPTDDLIYILDRLYLP